MTNKPIDYGNACIVHLKNNDKCAAETMLKSMVDNINQYHTTSLYAIQYDVYMYMLNMSKKKHFKSKFTQNTDSDLKLELRAPKHIQYPSKELFNSINDTESFINDLISHVKEYENNLCKQRNSYIYHNSDQLLYKTRSVNSQNGLKTLVKSLVTIKV